MEDTTSHIASPLCELRCLCSCSKSLLFLLSARSTPCTMSMTAVRDGGVCKTIAPKRAKAAASRAPSMVTAVQRVSQAASASTTGPQRLWHRSDRGLHITRVDHKHERHAQHVGMHAVESVNLLHGSAELKIAYFDQNHALGDVCATCAASRTVAHSSVWSVSDVGMRRRRLKSASSPSVQPSLPCADSRRR